MQQNKLWRTLAATTLAATLCLLPVANLHASENENEVKATKENPVEKATDSAKETSVEKTAESTKEVAVEKTAESAKEAEKAKTTLETSKVTVTASTTESQEQNQSQADKLSPLAKEQAKDDKKYEKVWKTPVVVYGAALSIDEISMLREMFGLGNVTALSETSVDSSDLYRFLGSSAPDSDMISSVAVQKREKGYGVRVKNVTPDKITEITEAMYTNAAISAGVHDCQIMVASPRPVTGESALAGVYKAFMLKGEKFDTKQIQVSQNELRTVNAINQSHMSDKNYNPTGLDRAVLDTKLAIQEKAAKLGSKLAASEISNLLNQNLAKYGLDNIVKTEQIEQLSKVFEAFQNTDALNSPVVREQLEILGKKLQAVFDQFHADAVKAGFWDRIVQFVNDVWQTVMTTVDNLVNELGKKTA